MGHSAVDLNVISNLEAPVLLMGLKEAEISLDL